MLAQYRFVDRKNSDAAQERHASKSAKRTHFSSLTQTYPPTCIVHKTNPFGFPTAALALPVSATLASNSYRIDQEANMRKPTHTSRREFLERSGAAVVAVTAVPVIEAQSQAQAANTIAPDPSVPRSTI